MTTEADLDSLLEDNSGEESGGSTPPKDGSDSSVIKEMRKQLREAQKNQKDLTAELETLRTEKRTNEVGSVFEKFQLPKTAVPVFLKVHEGEVTEDAVREFAGSLGLTAPSEDQAPTEPEPQGFQPIVGAGTAPTNESGVSQEEADRLLRTDPDRYFRLKQAGRIPGLEQIGRDLPDDRRR